MVAPGPILTYHLEAAGPQAQQGAAMSTPMRRVGRPAEVAQVVLWLCSAQSSFVTGTVVPIDGGQAAGNKPQHMYLPASRWKPSLQAVRRTRGPDRRCRTGCRPGRPGPRSRDRPGAVPVDPAAAERDQAIGLRLLFVHPGHVQVEVQARIGLGRRPAGLQRDHGSGSARRRAQHPAPAAERPLAHLVAERGAPEVLARWRSVMPSTTTPNVSMDTLLPSLPGLVLFFFLDEERG